jgi:putative acetyltransferase
VQIEVDDPYRADVLELLAEHLADMYATSPPESVHALDPGRLAVPAITFWTVRDGGALLGCGALKELSAEHGEIKSMRTATAARGRGVGTRMLAHILAEADARGYGRVSLETGAQDFFAPALRLYQRAGFTRCDPFGDYQPDVNSIFLTRTRVAATPAR